MVCLFRTSQKKDYVRFTVTFTPCQRFKALIQIVLEWSIKLSNNQENEA